MKAAARDQADRAIKQGRFLRGASAGCRRQGGQPLILPLMVWRGAAGLRWSSSVLSTPQAGGAGEPRGLAQRRLREASTSEPASSMKALPGSGMVVMVSDQELI